MRGTGQSRPIRWLIAAVAAGYLGLTMTGASPVRAAHNAASTLVKSAHTDSDQPVDFGGLSGQRIPLPPIDPALYNFCKNNSRQPPDEPPSILLSTYLAGFSVSGKLNGSLPSGYPALAFAQSEGKDEGFFEAPGEVLPFRNHSILCVLATLQLDYHGLHGNQHLHELPPVKVSFLAFGFEPVTAIATLVQPPPAKPGELPPPLTAVIYQDQGLIGPPTSGAAPFTVVATAQLELKLTDVTVNGTPVNVGPSCRTNGFLNTPNNKVAPGQVVLTGGTKPNDPQPGYSVVNNGGALEGVATVPPFTGCITPAGENLDSLLTAAASGPGNFVRMIQGPACSNFQGFFGFDCVSFSDFLPPNVPVFNVRHGGSYSSSAPLVISQFGQNTTSGVTITCGRSTISGEFPDVSGPVRGALGSVRWSKISKNCTGSILQSDGITSTPEGTWQVTQEGTAYFGGTIYSDGATTNSNLQADAVGNVMLELTGTGIPDHETCHATLFGWAPAIYTNRGSVLNIFATSNGGAITQINVIKGCAGVLPAVGQDGFSPYGISATYVLKPGGITITSPPAPTH